MASVLKLFKNPAKVVYIFDKLGVSRIIPDSTYLKLKYRANFGKKLNLKNPQTYNEKLQWLKLYDRKPEYITMVDKYEAKKYVAERIGEEYIIPTLGVWDKVEDIDFDTLPDQFVLKCTHDCGGLVICRDKSQLNVDQAKKKLNKALKNNFYYLFREWPYKNVKPRIIAEKYMEDASTGELRDYKFFGFDGEVKIMLICSERNKAVKVDFYNKNFEHLDCRLVYPNSSAEIKKPETYDKMWELAEMLSMDIPELRVDFYEVNGKIYFGELTFFPAAGFGKFEPQEWDDTLGSWLKLPMK